METVQTHLRKDPILAALMEQIDDPKVPNYKGEVYEYLLQSIISQQLSAKAAATIYKRFIELFKGTPPPQVLMNTSLETLRQAGVSKQKAGYLLNVADFFRADKYKNTDWNTLSDDEIIKDLTMIKGVGKWTVQMILMFSLGREDVLPLDDLVVRKNMMNLYGIQGRGKVLEQKLLEVAEPWRPYRSYACFYLWRAG